MNIDMQWKNRPPVLEYCDPVSDCLISILLTMYYRLLIMYYRYVSLLADGGDKIKYVLGPAGCGKTVTVNNVVSQLQSLPAQDQNDVGHGWQCVRVDVQYTHTLPQFYKLLSQVLVSA